MMRDLTGTRFGRLIVTGFNHKSKSSSGKMIYYYWNCKCDCGNECIRTYNSLKLGHTRSCGCLKLELIKELGMKHRKSSGEASFNSVYRNYKRQAKSRNLEFNLNKEEFKKLTSSDCWYCGRPPSNKTVRAKYPYVGTYIYNGLDRINSSKEYSTDNVIPCCWKCNRAKSNMDFNEFLDWVSDVYRNTHKPPSHERNLSL